MAMYASTYHSPPKIDYPYQEQQQLSGSTQDVNNAPTKPFTVQDNQKIKNALKEDAAA
ncbi:hypothetical protein NBRC116598_21090 [Pseudophaeobacter arcticus]|uniref:Uncharacterized protein n=2 Tax=Pseudophaeobacter arcticus TaxID=385492 RepID=A0ABQ0ALB5_9RHOB